MDENITVSRETIETFIQVAKNILEDTKSGAPERLERAEIAIINNERTRLKEAVFQAERSLFEVDMSRSTAAQMSINAEKRRHMEDNLVHVDFSEDKMNHIEGRRR